MNSHFYNLLEKALAKTITEEETFELWDYIDEWESWQNKLVESDVKI